MPNSIQHIAPATLRRLGGLVAPRLEKELAGMTATKPIALALPCHADEFGTPALDRILLELGGATYVSRVVVGIDGADEAAWRLAHEIFAVLPQETALLWNDGPGVKGFLASLERAGYPVGAPGKGRNLWLAVGCVLALGRERVVAAHDCDILTYDREFLARLCYPVVHPDFEFTFCKGFGSRFSDRLHGRVTRLLFSPLLNSLRSVTGHGSLLDFLGAFRCPLGGEFCADAEFLRRVEMPSGWGVEVGLLTEAFRIACPREVCQVEVAGRYDHKHQDLCPDDPERGLHRMAREVASQLIGAAAIRNSDLADKLLEDTADGFDLAVQEAVRNSLAEARVNGLACDLREEQLAASTFSRAVRDVAKGLFLGRGIASQLPAWGRIESENPEIFRALPAIVASSPSGSPLTIFPQRTDFAVISSPAPL